MSETPVLKIKDAAIYERRLAMRVPFRFGAATVTEATQAFLSLTIEDSKGRIAEGYAAELMVPKWFDKNPDLGNAENEDQLRQSLHMAVALAKTAEPATAFELHARIEPQHHNDAAKRGFNGLIASFGLALVDRAILDALCRLNDLSFTDAIRINLPGINASTTPDLAAFDISVFLEGLKPQPSLFLRHTVGYIDALRPDDIKGHRLNDGLPECLEEEIATYGLRYFKLKVSGRPKEDTERLKAIAAVLATLPDYQVTLDGNEQFADEDSVLDLLAQIDAEPALAQLRRSLLFIEQPIARHNAFNQSVSRLAGKVPVEIDESDGTPDAFLLAKAQGYRGISSKSCKGFYRSVLNAMRISKWNGENSGGYFMSAEDLTTQAGIAVQQDLALAALLGLRHIERNGHHYVSGMAGATDGENHAWLSAHPDLYRNAGDGRAKLSAVNGQISLATAIAAKGLGVDADAAKATFNALQASSSDQERTS
ncbi:mandelate racemase [Agrobacterium sp. AGB01]|uniref:enolase C-terminal domain-like protein n=1 Tax=Agrobacterium sp. AGB01 TaxID=2769302 RepID=UPI00177FC4B0|nr:enolase C-terminal domain-like protein [Agrobacterium sp. AGB01]MBD9388354.1 mandelate racemase [Agrobacterium sp. AGB01]